MDRMDCLNEANGEAVGLLTTYRAIECTHCGEMIAANSEICPICGGKHN